MSIRLKGGWKEVYQIICKAKGPISLKKMRDLTDMNYNSLRSAVVYLTNRGIIERVEKGVYKAKSE